MTDHPEAPVPNRLFDDEREQRWRARFTAVRTSRPRWARDAPDRCAYTSTASGTTEVYAWDRATDEHRRVTDRRSGTGHAELPPDGEWIWWFADSDGDEFGHWVREPFAAGTGAVEPALPGVEDGYGAGLEIGRRVVAVGTSTDEGTRIWLRRGDGPAEVVYSHPEDAGVGALSEDEDLLAIGHSEHGDSRHPDVRVLRVSDGATVAEKSDGPGKGLSPLSFAPVAGDNRLLVAHERRGRDELLIWDPTTGAETELAIDLPGELHGEFTPDGAALLVWHTHAARTRLHRYDLATGGLTELPVAPGCVGGAEVRPDGTVEYTCSSAAHPASVRALAPDGTDRVLLVPPGPRAPGSVPVRDLWVDGPGGRVHALVAEPVREAGDPPPPALFSLHGGPHAADEDRFSAVRATWVDAGFVVVEVNYRGSTGYGSAWRDAIEGRPGSTELADVAAVLDRCVADGLVDPRRCVVEGWSWGGYLALLAVGTQPERWAAGIAGVPVADYLTAYADEMEQLRAFDRALFGGSPQERPEAYRAASPLTYVDRVRAPVLVLAGENDPRCPIRQVDNYLDALAARGDLPFEVTRFDAGHGSMVVDQTIAHTATEVGFARRAIDGDEIGGRVAQPTPVAANVISP
ncbi:S9 family peptidase [Pseudonocardia humida]|uniref:S9 family peptidase n=1 Tax=Pseudonocardia humida TaxID=2800819 RepID=A0ABT0ZU61_9PSEU|nr:prolyl oligopeptidase family serine peptidase [Pseudonocardia humida]MCO1654244.1 S9 family peptidase [Pseudonocardia humida]